MSFWSTLKSMFRTQERPQTRLTISIRLPNGSAFFAFPLSLQQDVENTLQADQARVHVEIWKCFGPPFDTGPVSGQTCLYRLYRCPPKPNLVNDGSHELRPEGSARLQ